MRSVAKSFFTVIFVLIITAFSGASVFAATLSTKNITADNNRLFDVPIIMKSKSVISAATFNIYYDSSTAVFRKAYTDITSAKVRCVDSGKRVKVIFLCPNGVKISKNSLLLNVRFKTISEGASKIKISAEDCVDYNAESFPAPKPIVCKVNVNGKAGIVRSGKSAGRNGIKSYNKSYDKSSSRSSDKNNSGNDGDSSVSDKEEEGLLEDFSSIAGEKNNPILMVIFIAAAVIAAVTFAAIMLRRENDKNPSKINEDVEEDEEEE